MKYIVALDQGTTSTRAIVFTANDLKPVFTHRCEFTQHYPSEGQVEHDPNDIWNDTNEVLTKAKDYIVSNSGNAIALGITNQRETVVMWDSETGKELHKAIVWQDRRTANRCEELKQDNHEKLIRDKTGLVIDPYFSATKISYLLEKTNSYEKAKEKKVLVGTIDTYLVWKLTKGKVFATDITNASRTQLCNIKTKDWDDELLNLHNIPRECLANIKDNADDFGTTDLLGGSVPIAGIAGDQQAAAIGQACLNKGETKSTYGTGCFVIAQGDSEVIIPKSSLLGTVGYKVGDQVSYAIEGSIFVAGAAMQWLRDKLQIIDNAPASEELAKQAKEDSQVFLVPAFTGLGAPHWNPNARATIVGMTLDTNRADLVSATLQSIAYSTYDLFKNFANEGITPQLVNIDGGMANNNWFAQFLANILAVKISRPENIETTATGAAFLAGLYVGEYSSLSDIAKLRIEDKTFVSTFNDDERQVKINAWQAAIETTLAHANKSS